MGAWFSRKSNTKQYRFYWSDKQRGWIAYDEQTNATLNQEYVSGKKQFVADIMGRDYVIDFEDMKQSDKTNPRKFRRIKFEEITHGMYHG